MGISVLQRQQLSKSRLRKLASSTPSLAFKKRWGYARHCRTGLQWCALRLCAALSSDLNADVHSLGIAVEESLRLAQAPSQEGILLTQTEG